MTGEWLPVERVTNTNRWETDYNLRVADYHTYFVGCDEWGFSVWAHNACLVDAQANIAKMIPAEQARINALIAKAAKSKDPGLAETVTILEGYGVKIKDVNHYVGSPLREVDIELVNGTIIQVKKLPSASALTGQLAATEKATGQPVVGYVIATHKKGTQIVNDVNQGSQIATNSIDDLISLVK